MKIAIKKTLLLISAKAMPVQKWLVHLYCTHDMTSCFVPNLWADTKYNFSGEGRIVYSPPTQNFDPQNMMTYCTASLRASLVQISEQ
jgi:hypothetical protein